MTFQFLFKEISDLTELLNFASGFASIIGLIITVIVFFKIRNIRKEFLFKSRVPTLIAQLEKYSSTISRLCDDFEISKGYIDAEFAKCQADLENIKQKVNGSPKKSINSILKIIKYRGRSRDFNKDQVWNIYTGLLTVIQELENLKEDNYWGSRNG